MGERRGSTGLVLALGVLTVIKGWLVIAFLLHSYDSKQETNETRIAEPPKREILRQPSCPVSYLKTVLRELCRELSVLRGQCTPEDVHDLEKHKVPAREEKGEPRGAIVGCVAAGLLLTSLAAAFVELYKAKSQTPVKARPPMNRKCSLADLTVLKHNRKELVRRESIMEIPENGGPLKPLGFRPPPLFRRSSFPVGPSEPSFGYQHDSRRTSIESRRLSIIESRRNSVDYRQGSRPMSRQASIDNRAISFDESPDRRHWSRLVHRH